MTARTQTAVYVYGIVPGDVQLAQQVTGVGSPPGLVRLVRHRDLAALASDVALDAPLGTREDLVAHAALLDSVVADAPVLPLRFGAVVSSDEAVTSELLAPHRAAFQAALRDLDGYVQFVVKGRYEQDVVLRQVLRDNPQAAALAAAQARAAQAPAGQQQGAAQPAAPPLQVQLGEVVSRAIEQQRAADARALSDALAGQVTASVLRPPVHEMDAAHAAFLVDSQAEGALRQALRRLAGEWSGRVGLQLTGPMAAYDFVGEAAPATGGTR